MDPEYIAKIEKEDWELVIEQGTSSLTILIIGIFALSFFEHLFEPYMAWCCGICCLGYFCFIISMFFPLGSFVHVILNILGSLAEMGVTFVAFDHSLWPDHKLTLSWIAPTVVFGLYLWRFSGPVSEFARVKWLKVNDVVAKRVVKTGGVKSLDAMVVKLA